MTETTKIVMMGELTKVLEDWVSTQLDNGRLEACAELPRMMALAALAVAEASNAAYTEGYDSAQEAG